MDKYDKAIAWLKKHPEEINEAWMYTDSHEKAGCLFSFVGRGETPKGANCGCITQIRNGFGKACKDGQVDFELTNEIMADDRIPLMGITIDHLPVFAEWQREIDKRYNRN